MKIIITESHLKTIINEFDVKRHYNERMNLRFLDITTYDVIAIYKGEPYSKTIIGKYKIPNDARSTIANINNKISNSEYDIPHDLALIIYLYEFKITPESVTFIGNPEEQIKHKKMFEDQQNYRIFLQTPVDNKGRTSHGRFLVCIVRGDGISTVILIRNQTTSIEELKKHMFRNNIGLSNINYINNPQTQLDTYIDIDKLRSKQSPEPQTPAEQQPQLSDKERRLQLYKEKMKRKFGKS